MHFDMSNITNIVKRKQESSISKASQIFVHRQMYIWPYGRRIHSDPEGVGLRMENTLV